MNPVKPTEVVELEKKKIRHERKMELQSLTRLQLVALAVQKSVMPYDVSLGQKKPALVEALVELETVLEPEIA